MCKHVAAVLYGIGARLDQQPELLFKLAQGRRERTDRQGGPRPPACEKCAGAEQTLGSEDLSAIFGLEMAQNTKSHGEPVDPVPSKPKRRQIKCAKNAEVSEKKSGVKRAGTGRRRLSPALRKRIAEVMRARWEARKRAVAQQADAKNPIAKQTARKPARRRHHRSRAQTLIGIGKGTLGEKNKEHLNERFAVMRAPISALDPA